MKIVLYEHHPLYTDVTLRSIKTFWNKHPDIKIVRNKYFSSFDILEKEYEFEYIDKQPNGSICELSAGQIFIRPVEYNKDVFKDKEITVYLLTHGFNINNGEHKKPDTNKFNSLNYCNMFSFDYMFQSGRIYNNLKYVGNGHSYMNNKSCLVTLEDTNDYSIERMNEMYIKGKRINLTPFQYIENDSITIETRLQYLWKK